MLFCILYIFTQPIYPKYMLCNKMMPRLFSLSGWHRSRTSPWVSVQRASPAVTSDVECHLPFYMISKTYIYSLYHPLDLLHILFYIALYTSTAYSASHCNPICLLLSSAAGSCSSGPGPRAPRGCGSKRTCGALSRCPWRRWRSPRRRRSGRSTWEHRGAPKQLKRPYIISYCVRIRFIILYNVILFILYCIIMHVIYDLGKASYGEEPPRASDMLLSTLESLYDRVWDVTRVGFTWNPHVILV